MPGYLQQITDRLQAIEQALAIIGREQRHQGRMIMSLTQNEQQAVTDLSAAVETLATDLGQALSAAQQSVADLRTQITALGQQHTVDAQTISELMATVDGMESDVVGALSPITQRITGIDRDLKSPATPDSPLSAQP